MQTQGAGWNAGLLNNALGVRVGAIWPESVQPCSYPVKQGRGDQRECSQTPLKPCTVNLKHSLCNPEPKPTQDKAGKQRGRKDKTPIPFLNPDPVVWLVGCANEALVVMDGQEVSALVDLGAQVSTISEKFCEELDLEIQPWVGCWN